MGGSSSRTVNKNSVAMVQQLVSDNCVVIFSKTTCGYCNMAKRVFNDIGTPYVAVELNKREDGPDVQDVLAEMTGQRSVPRVFINGQCVGGGSETVQLQKEGKLLELLAQCSQSSKSS